MLCHLCFMQLLGAFRILPTALHLPLHSRLSTLVAIAVGSLDRNEIFNLDGAGCEDHELAETLDRLTCAA